MGDIRQRERCDVLPLGADEGLGHDGSRRVDVAQRLPAIRVVDGCRIEFGAGSQIHRIVCRLVAGVVRVGNARLPAGLVAELVRAVPVPEVEDRAGGHIPDSRRRAAVIRRVGSVVTEPAHQGIENARPVTWEEIDRRSVRREADRRVDVGQRALSGWPAESAAESGPDRVMVVGGPGVKDAGVDDGEGARDHRRTELRIPNSLQRRRVPQQNDAVAGG